MGKEKAESFPAERASATPLHQEMAPLPKVMKNGLHKATNWMAAQLMQPEL